MKTTTEINQPADSHSNTADGNLMKPSNLTLSAYCHCTNCQRLNGAPFVWTTHWKNHALHWENKAAKSLFGLSELQVDHLSNVLDVFESIKGRKLKLRCKRCGSPLGSYNLVKREWTIWGTTFERQSVEKVCDLSNSPSPLLSSDSSNTIIGWNYIKPTAHQFYGTRLIDIADDLTRWEGYENSSAELCA
ncbi:hypothetical protein O181_035910 [Austropuccinia psidii MF-1]|uniref:CENP-V/GFA domain-containing protein n=1 Tax=Austropuccinia psidii MF-1 TaxID=1389203 RepID=A0A9Q3HBM9_9BASI|nr:hypothetical protein [Austropuccinia psidii MF-1]